MVEVYLSVINGQLCELVSVGEDGGNEEQKNGETCLGDHLGVGAVPGWESFLTRGGPGSRVPLGQGDQHSPDCAQW